jgi:hypothetical protein
MGRYTVINFKRTDIYNTHGHKLRVPSRKKAQFVTALGIADINRAVMKMMAVLYCQE